MPLNGMFLGGFAQGWQNQSNLDLEQQRQQQSYDLGVKGLQLQQQAQQNAQHRADMARIDKVREDAISGIISSVQSLKQSGADDTKIYKALGPWIDQLKKLTKTSGLDPSFIDAQIAGALSKPATDLSVLTGGGTPSAPTQPVASPAAAPAPQTNYSRGVAMLKDKMQPAGGGDIINDNTTFGAPINTPIAQTPQAQAEVDKYTLALAKLPADANPNVKAAITLRLQEALKKNNPELSFHNVKDESGNDHPVIFNGRTGQLTNPNGEPFVQQSGENSDAAAITKAITEGRQPPVLTGLYKNTKSVQAALAKSGFNLAEAQLEWKSAQKQVQSLNGPQMIRYAGLAKSVVNTIDEVRNLSKEMDNSGIPLLNAAKLQAYIQTQGNSPNGQLAARYLAGINTLKEEFANLAQGGYAPTEAAWGLANQQINGNYGVKQLDASLTEVQRLLRYRLNGIPNFGTLGPNAPNRYFAPQGNETEQPAAAPSSGGGWSIQRIQ